MACFTTEDILQITHYSKSCKVGDDIWIFGKDLSMFRFDTKTKTCEKIEYNKERSYELCVAFRVNRPFHLKYFRTARHYAIFAANEELYMCSSTYEHNCRLLKFDPPTREWKRLMDFEANFKNYIFIMVGRELYMTPEFGFMQILNLDTSQTKRIKFPPGNDYYEGDRSNICELNGVIYLVFVFRAGWRSIYQYDKNASKFVAIKKRDRVQCPFQNYGLHMGDFAWSGNNKIFQAFVLKRKQPHPTDGINEEYLVIDYFDLETEQWNTVFQSNTEKSVKNIFGGGDDNIYVVSENLIIVDIREISLSPSLQNLSLVQLADESVANYYTENYIPLTMMLPSGLRNTYDNMVTRKLADMPLGRLENEFGLIEKWTVEKNEIEAQREQLKNEFDAIKKRYEEEDEKLKQAVLMKQMAIDREDRKFEDLRKEYDWLLTQQMNGCLNDGIPQSEYQIARFGELVERFRSVTRR